MRGKFHVQAASALNPLCRRLVGFLIGREDFKRKLLCPFPEKQPWTLVRLAHGLAISVPREKSYFRFELFWKSMQHRTVVRYRYFDTPCRSLIQGPGRPLTIADGTDTLSRNVVRKLPFSVYVIKTNFMYCLQLISSINLYIFRSYL